MQLSQHKGIGFLFRRGCLCCLGCEQLAYCMHVCPGANFLNPAEQYTAVIRISQHSFGECLVMVPK